MMNLSPEMIAMLKDAAPMMAGMGQDLMQTGQPDQGAMGGMASMADAQRARARKARELMILSQMRGAAGDMALNTGGLY